MSAFERAKMNSAQQQLSRVMSMLSLVEAALRQEMDFQDDHIERPIMADAFIPGLGEVIDAIGVCTEQLQNCWDTLSPIDK